jgi:hypothetical protein
MSREAATYHIVEQANQMDKKTVGHRFFVVATFFPLVRSVARMVTI